MSAEGQVERQKLNQTVATNLSFVWVFGVQLDLLEKSIPANAEKSVDILPSFLAMLLLDSPLVSIFGHPKLDTVFTSDNELENH